MRWMMIGARTRSQERGQVGAPYLYQFQRPSLDVPFPLRDAANVVVDEETFGRDAEDQAVGHGADAGDQLRDGEAGKGVVEGVDGFQDDLVRVFAVVGAAVGWGRGRAIGGLRGGVGGLRVDR